MTPLAEVAAGAAGGVGLDRVVPPHPDNRAPKDTIQRERLENIQNNTARTAELLTPQTPVVIRQTILLDGNGDGEITVEVANRMAYAIHRVGIGSAALAAVTPPVATFQLYENAVDPANFLDAVGPVSGGAFVYPQPGLYMAVQSKLVIVVDGAVASDLMAVRIQGALVPEDAAQNRFRR